MYIIWAVGTSTREKRWSFLNNTKFFFSFEHKLSAYISVGFMSASFGLIIKQTLKWTNHPNCQWEEVHNRATSPLIDLNPESGGFPAIPINYKHPRNETNYPNVSREYRAKIDHWGICSVLKGLSRRDLSAYSGPRTRYSSSIPYSELSILIYFAFIPVGRNCCSLRNRRWRCLFFGFWWKREGDASRAEGREAVFRLWIPER